MSKASVGAIPQLTSLRFFAAFGILLLHYRDYLGDVNPFVQSLVVGGRFGVTFFFVLSGFILTYNYESTFAEQIRSRDFWRFQKFRFARIYPTYLLALCLDTPIQVLCKRVDSYPDAWYGWLVNAIAIQSWIPLAPYVLFWNIPSWSISCEFFFYLCFPFICSCLARTLKTLPAAIGLAVVTVLVTGATTAWIMNEITLFQGINDSTSYALQFYLPPLRISEFIVGSIAGRMFSQSRAGSFRQVFLGTEFQRNLTLIILGSITFALLMKPQYAGPSASLWLLDQAFLNIIFAIPFAGIILAIASGKNLVSKPLAHPILVLLGEASYALYITHFAAFTIRESLFSGDKRALVSCAFMLWSIIWSVVIYLLFEQPLRKKLRTLKFFA